MNRILLLSILFLTSTAFAQSTPDWRPINRVYKNDGVTVGSVGSAGQIKAGHVLTAKSFPVAIATDNTKLAYFNLSANANDALATHNLTNVGTVPFAGTNIFGVSGAATFNGSNQSLSSTDAFFDPGSVSFAVGGWFNATTWAAGAVQSLFTQADTTGNISYGIIVSSANQLSFVAGNATIFTYDVSGFASGSWHHVALIYNSAGSMSGFLDGAAIGSGLATSTPVGSARILRIGARFTAAAAFLAGGMQDVFFVNNALLTPQDIRRLYSTRIDHNKNLIAKRQDWQFRQQYLGVSGNPYQKLPFVWIDPTDSNSLFLDLSDLPATSKLDIRLYDVQQ